MSFLSYISISFSFKIKYRAVIFYLQISNEIIFLYFQKNSDKSIKSHSHVFNGAIILYMRNANGQ